MHSYFIISSSSACAFVLIGEEVAVSRGSHIAFLAAKPGTASFLLDIEE